MHGVSLCLNDSFGDFSGVIKSLFLYFISKDMFLTQHVKNLNNEHTLRSPDCRLNQRESFVKQYLLLRLFEVLVLRLRGNNGFEILFGLYGRGFGPREKTSIVLLALIL